MTCLAYRDHHPAPPHLAQSARSPSSHYPRDQGCDSASQTHRCTGRRRNDVNLVIVLHEYGVLERVPHAAVLVLESDAIRGHKAFAFWTEDTLSVVRHIHHLKRIHVNVKDMRFAKEVAPSPPSLQPVASRLHDGGRTPSDSARSQTGPEDRADGQAGNFPM